MYYVKEKRDGIFCKYRASVGVNLCRFTDDARVMTNSCASGWRPHVIANRAKSVVVEALYTGRKANGSVCAYVESSVRESNHHFAAEVNNHMK